MKKRLAFRSWFYFRQGWSTYFAFIFAAINTTVVTYYLAIERAPFLKEIFPSFILYLAVMTAIGIPLLVTVGYIHYKRSLAYHAEADITTESNPYYYKIPPGYWREALIPMFITMTNLLVKLSKNEKLTDSEIKEIDDIQNKLDILKKGGFLGEPKSFHADSKHNIKKSNNNSSL